MSQKGTRTLGLQVSSTFPVQFQPPLGSRGPLPRERILYLGGQRRYNLPPILTHSTDPVFKFQEPQGNPVSLSTRHEKAACSSLVPLMGHRRIITKLPKSSTPQLRSVGFY